MRLGFIEEVVRRQLDELKVTVVSTDGKLTELRGIHSAVAAVRILEQTGVLKSELAAVRSIQTIMLAADDHIGVAKKTADEFASALQTLRNRATTLVQALKDLSPSEDPNSIFVKVPDSTDWRELANWVDEIGKTLEQILVNDHVKGHVQLGQFDTGSRWFQLFLGAEAEVLLVATIAYAAIRVQDAVISLEAKKKVAEELVSDVDNRIEIKNLLASACIASLEKEKERILAEVVEKSGAPVDDHEYRERIKHGIRQFQEWSQRGLEIHPALTTPIEIGQLFPDATKVLEATKLIAPKLIVDLGGHPAKSEERGN